MQGGEKSPRSSDVYFGLLVDLCWGDISSKKNPVILTWIINVLYHHIAGSSLWKAQLPNSVVNSFYDSLSFMTSYCGQVFLVILKNVRTFYEIKSSLCRRP